MFGKLYKLMGSPVNGKYMLWYRYLLPRRITLAKNPAIYCWLGINFMWEKKKNDINYEKTIGI
jgi:hypothetical protein